MEKLIKWFFSPLLFGIAFIGPLITQTFIALEVPLPLSPLLFGLVVGVGLGLMAQLRGSWLWIK